MIPVFLNLGTHQLQQRAGGSDPSASLVWVGELFAPFPLSISSSPLCVPFQRWSDSIQGITQFTPPGKGNSHLTLDWVLSAVPRVPLQQFVGWKSEKKFLIFLFCLFKKLDRRTSLFVPWFRLCASTAGDTGSLPGQGTRILQAMLCGQERERN